MPIKSDLYCKTHGKKLSEKAGRLHYKRGCDVWYVDPNTGELTRSYGKKTKEAPGPPSESLDQQGAGLEEHVKGFEEPVSEILFIYHKGGKVERFWDRFPEHQSIYMALVQGKFFAGTPAEFVEASAQFMLAAAGYESVPCIIPVGMQAAYEETARLIREGALVVIHGEDGKMRLKVNHKEEGSHAEDHVAQVGVQPGTGDHQPERLSPKEGEEESSQAKQRRAGTTLPGRARRSKESK